MEDEEIKQRVRDGYGEIARDDGGCCGPDPGEEHARQIGYDDSQLEAVPEEANMGLGCGNPAAMARLEEGDTVLDLGSGAGMDAFVAAEEVGEEGHVIGVDMTPEMLARARNAATRRGVGHFVDFRRGDIENLPVVDESVDVVLSNCVINLTTDKRRVFEEVWRVLVGGGRLAISDICLSDELPAQLRDHDQGHLACISGARPIDEYVRVLEEIGFVDVETNRTDASALVDGATGDSVFAEALDKLGPGEIEKVRERLWSVKFFARKR